MAVAGNGDRAALMSAPDASAARKPAKMRAQAVYEWLVRRRADELPKERVLTAIRTAAGVVPLGGNAVARDASTALMSAHSDAISTSIKAEDVFFDVLFTCAKLPTPLTSEQQRTALQAFVKEDHLPIPTTTDNSDQWWQAQTQARRAYFAARRAFFLVRIELLRVAAFHADPHTPTCHPQAAFVEDVVHQLVSEGLVDALLEELCGRAHVAAPAFYSHLRSPLPSQAAERHLRAAQRDWERQLLREEELLRELLLLALYMANERVPVRRMTKIFEHVLQWPAKMLPDVFSDCALTSPVVQRQLRRISSIGSMVLMLLARRVSSSQLDDEFPTVTEWTKDFVLAEAWRDVDIDEHHVALCNQLTESGVVLVAWASLLAKLFRRMDGQPSGPLEANLQGVIQMSEQAHAFHQISDVFQRLVLRCASSTAHSTLSATEVAIFQVVGAMFLDDALSTLGYVEQLEDPAQLHSIVKLIVPTLGHSAVTDALLQERPIGDSTAPEFSSALSMLVKASRNSWPEDLLPGLKALSALCSSSVSASRTTAPPSANRLRSAAQLSLNELSKNRTTHSSSSGQWRQLPPDDYLEFLEGQEAVLCKRTFAYADEDRMTVHEGVKGLLSQDDNGDYAVQWQIATAESRNAYDGLLAALDILVDQVQTQPLIAIQSTEMETLTAFLDWIVHTSNTANGSSIVVQVFQQWSFARLKQWWRSVMGVTSTLDIPALLFRSKVSLPVLESASREDLVAWGIHDRFTREQILARIPFPGGASSVSAHQQRRASSQEELQRDGLTHLLRMLLGFLDGFLNADQHGDTDGLEWTSKQLDFITSVLQVIAAVTDSLSVATDVLINEIGGGSEECVSLITKSARKLFDHFESDKGSYPGMFATVSILSNVARWCVAHEAVGVPSPQLAAAERVWLVATVEFVMELLGSIELWQFEVVAEKWSLQNVLLLVFVSLLSASQRSSASGVLKDFQDALRNTIVTDSGLLVKVLRASSRLLAANDRSSRALEDDSDRLFLVDEAKEIYPFVFEREIDDSVAALLARESLVEASLRLLVMVLDEQSFTNVAVATVLLQPIDIDATKDLNLVTLCAGYLAYPLTKRPQIVHASLKLLRRAAEVVASSSSASPGIEVFSEASSSLVALFRQQKDLDYVRDALLSLVRQPSRTEVGRGFRRELLGFLSACLETQPGFFAVVVLEDPGELDRCKRLVGLVERLLESSDESLETETDALCSVLRFVHHVWIGGVKGRRKLHTQIAKALRKSPKFWRNVTLALRVRLPIAFDAEDIHVGHDEGDDAAIAALSTGRAGVLGCLVRGLIFEILACEWHYHCTSSPPDDHPLISVLESFREDGLYAQWLRTFTRLDFVAPRFVDAASSVSAYLLPFPDVSSEESEAGGDVVLKYYEEVIAAMAALQTQLRPLSKDQTLESVLARARWSLLTAAHTQAQIYALAQWKVFMELYSLQFSNDGGGLPRENTSGDSSFAESRKRKESMIASPLRGARTSSTPVSPMPHHSSSSLFSGDRTSYGVIQVLSDVVALQCEKHEQHHGSRGGMNSNQSSMDIITMSHLKHVTELLVSMLHHQIRVVVRKTRDPKLSSTRPRDESSGARSLRLTVTKSIELLALVERAAHILFGPASRDQDQAMGDGDNSDTLVWEPLFGSKFHDHVSRLTFQLRCSLLTAALLLTRHIAAQLESAGVAHEVQQRAVIVQVKWAHHAIQSIKLCDEKDSTSEDSGRLIRLSWSLLHALLDDFAAVTCPHEKQKFKLDAIITLAPLISLLQHETSGLRALFEIVIDKFQTQTPANSAAQQIQACAVLKGLNAIVWNSRNVELCRHVMLDEDPVNGFSVLRFFAKRLVPCLQECMKLEHHKMRGYPASSGQDDAGLARSKAHQAWCSVLMMAAGLVRQLPPQHRDNSVWEFVSAAEPLLAAALGSTQGKLNRAVVDEQACALAFLNALSSSPSRRKQWREMLPRNCVVLMEQTRFVLRRACILVGNSSYTATYKREQAQLLKKPRRLSVTAWPLSTSPRALALGSSASLTFAHQTLLHEHLEAASTPERRNLSGFYDEMESKLIHVVEQASHLLLKWTASIASQASTVMVNGTRAIDYEQLIPLLAFVTPSESLTMSCDPSIGHLCVAMEYCVDQLKKTTDESKTMHAIAANALQTSALLFLKTFLIHLDRQEADEVDADQQQDLVAFFEQLQEELKDAHVGDNGLVDLAFFKQIVKVVQLKLTTST